MLCVFGVQLCLCVWVCILRASICTFVHHINDQYLNCPLVNPIFLKHLIRERTENEEKAAQEAKKARFRPVFPPPPQVTQDTDIPTDQISANSVTSCSEGDQWWHYSIRCALKMHQLWLSLKTPGIEYMFWYQLNVGFSTPSVPLVSTQWQK